MTSDRMFFGALENAYSSPVIEARISEIAIKTYAPVCAQTLMETGAQAVPSALKPEALVPHSDIL